jgi:orotidine-5'-phosphate decarboxylase
VGKDKIIVALDVSTPEEARKFIEQLSEEVGAFKIGLQLFTAAGARFVREVVESGIKIFLDLKFHDIPNTVAKASIEAARLGVWMFNVHALGGSEMMHGTIMEVRDICRKENLLPPKIIAVTVLTSSNEETLNEVGIEANVQSQVLKLAKLTETSGLDGVVASPQEIQLIRNAINRQDFLIVTPGVRPNFATSDDQKRVLTPAEAVNAGADYLVIGRPILQAENPVRAVREIIKEIEKRQSRKIL